MQAASPSSPYPAWRWDQGRLEYLRVEHLGRLSAALCNVSGLEVSADDAEIRKQFYASTGLPFKPTHYTLWRNYGRVFKILFLAHSVQDRIQATSLAKAIHAAGGKQLDSDLFLEHVFALSRFPHPAFKDYQPSAHPVRPFIAVLRLLLLNPSTQRGVSPVDVCTRLIARGCVGDEQDSFFASGQLGASSSTETTRQVREMLKFASQHSALAWIGGRLVSAARIQLELLIGRLTLMSPPGMQQAAEDEIGSLALIAAGQRSKDPWTSKSQRFESVEPALGIKFLEGDRRLVQHARLERNRRLRKYVINKATSAAAGGDLQCHCCGLIPKTRYPWSGPSLLEVHHLLPLSSPARPNAAGTEFSGVVLICPTCHRAVHARYRLYLSEMNVGDFASEAEAVALYEQVRAEISKSTT
jgi:hypothetical protein